MSATLSVGYLDPASPTDGDAWDRYVHACPTATFFHLSGWGRILESYFGCGCHYLVARRGERIAGVLPLARVRNLIAGDALVSTPFLVYGGPAADDAEASAALANEAKRLAERLDVDYLELRNRTPLSGEWLGKDLYVYFRKEIEADPEANLRAIPRKQRAMVRKGIKAGLAADWTVDLERFYPIFVESYRNLGTPVFGKNLFRDILDVFADSCWLTTVMNGRDPVAGVLSFRFRDEILPYYGGGKESARGLYANDFMYWSVMARAAESGLRYFDYGRSKMGTGSFSFKKHWGFEPEPLYYQYHLVKARELPNLSPANPRFSLAIDAWKRIPLPIARWIGPPIARRLP